MTYAEHISSYEKELVVVGEEPEALSFVFREKKGLDLTAFVMLLRAEVTDEDHSLLQEIFQQLKSHMPAQYILGYEDFHGLRLAVDERVLIPRPETEELVDLILAENSGANLSVLDIGTGSGAIAISLKHSQPSWKVTGSDISTDALALAQENAKNHQLDMTFVESDVFSQITGKFDIIVSNPPYISREDEDEVGINVLASEPHTALFADEDGLAIYRQIIQQASQHLTPQGKLYFEIGYKQGDALKNLLATHFPNRRVRVLKDQFGQDRMVVLDD